MTDDAEDPPVEVFRVDRPLEVVEALLLELAHVNAVEAGPELRGSVDLGAGQQLLAPAILFLASAAFVIWRNSQVAVLVDIAYPLNTATRIALGDVPYA